MKELTQDNLKEIVNSQKTVIVQYGASWCGMCKIIKPKFKSLSETHPGIEFIYVDAEEFPESRNLAQIENLPTFAGFVDGKLIQQKSSSKEEAIKEIIHEITNH